MGVYNRRKVWGHEKLYHDDLNAEFDEVQSSVNNIETAQIVDASVTEQKLAQAAVSTGKIADDAVVETKIADGSVSRDKLASESVVSHKSDAYDSGEFHLGSGDVSRLAHGMKDDSGNPVAPKMVVAFRVRTGTAPWDSDYNVDLPGQYHPSGLYVNWDENYIYVKNTGDTGHDYRVLAW